jgi:hypothetical protein
MTIFSACFLTGSGFAPMTPLKTTCSCQSNSVRRSWRLLTAGTGNIHSSDYDVVCFEDRVLPPDRVIVCRFHGREYSVDTQRNMLGTASAALILPIGNIFREHRWRGTCQQVQPPSNAATSPIPIYDALAFARLSVRQCDRRACQLSWHPMRRHITTSPL